MDWLKPPQTPLPLWSKSALHDKFFVAADLYIIYTPWTGAIALLYPPRVRVRATVKLSATFFHEESSITIGGAGGGGGYESATVPPEPIIACFKWMWKCGDSLEKDFSFFSFCFSSLSQKCCLLRLFIKITAS